MLMELVRVLGMVGCLILSPPSLLSPLKVLDVDLWCMTQKLGSGHKRTNHLLAASQLMSILYELVPKFLAKTTEK